MRSSRQQAEHPLGVVIVDGFSEHRAIDDDRRVCPKHQAFAFARADRTRLRFSDSTDIGLGQFTWMNGFVDVGMYDVEVDARGAQQLRASGRSRGQHYSLHPLIFTCGTMADP